MNLSDLKKLEGEIVDYLDQLKKLNSDILEVTKKLSNTRYRKSELEQELFLEYVPLGYEIEATKAFGFSGTPYFKSGERLEVCKKNKKSIVIKRTKKFVTNKNTQPFTFDLIDCDENHRVKISELYHFLNSKDDFKKQFNSYLSRKESLENLGF